MITALTVLGLYVGGMICFALWDAHIGFGVEFDGDDWPPPLLAYIGWPITLVCTLVAGFVRSLESTKERRIKKTKERVRVRVAAEKEQEALLEQIEREMQEEEESRHVQAKGAYRR